MDKDTTGPPSRSAALPPSKSRKSLAGRHPGVSQVTDEAFMRRAFSLAAMAAERPGRSQIGCVVVLNGEIIGEACNEVGARHDPTAHAEMLAIRRAARNLETTALRGATLYTTLQPCGMCTMATIWARIGRIVYGAGRDQVHEMYFEDRHLNTIDFISDAFRDDLQLSAGVLGGRCAQLYFKRGDDVPAAEQGNV